MNTNKRQVYLDHAASALIHPSVSQNLIRLFNLNLGNSSSIHRSGVMASLELEKARNTIATKIGAESNEIYFTSGATEPNNLALIGAASANTDPERRQIVISSIEHSSVKQCLPKLKDMGYEVHTLEVNSDGLVSFSALQEILSQKTFLVSIMHANNEIGTIQDLKAIGALCKEHGCLFHSDGAQAFCKSKIDVKELNIDFYTMSSHKIHGTKGVGALFVKTGRSISPLFFGGGQEDGLRPGTVPVELIASMAFAVSLFNNEALASLAELKSKLVADLKKSIDGIQFNGSSLSQLPNLINIRIPEVSAKTLLQALDRAGIRASAGSACFSGAKTPSHVLKAIGLSNDQAFESVRVSWGLETPPEDIDYFVQVLKDSVSQLKVQVAPSA